MNNIISGKEFKKRYLKTDSNLLEKYIFSNKNMGSMLGEGCYFCVNENESQHYSEDKYTIKILYAVLSDNSKIYVKKGCSRQNTSFYKNIRKNVDGLFDFDEEIYTGLVIYNINVVKFL